MTETRQHLISAISFALTRCKRHLRTMAQSHNTDEARKEVAALIADQILDRSGLDVTQKPPVRGHKTPGG